MTLRRSYPLLFAVLLGAGIGMWLGGGGLYGMLSMVLCLTVALPTACLLLISRNANRKRKSEGVGSFDVGSAVLVLAVLSFWAAGAGIHSFRKAEVRRFVDRTLPLLDAHKAKTGVYPKRLDEVTSEPLPPYLRSRSGYSSDGSGFTFYSISPDDWISGQMFTDSHRFWQSAD